MIVRLGTPMRSYAGGAASVEAEGATVAELLDDLERRCPGLRFRIVDEQGRIRTHVKVWLDQDRVRDLAHPVGTASELTIMQALSGG